MNKNLLSKIAIFAVGSAVGSVVTWKIVETKYKRIAQEEIDSVREVYAKTYGESDEEEPDEQDIDDEDKDEYERIIQSSGYGADDEDEEEDEEEEDEYMSEPYVIDEEDYDENGYDAETLYYYDDGVLVYSITDEVVDDIDGLVGNDSITQLEESGEDYIYVRNDELKTDFEILRDRRNYSEVE